MAATLPALVLILRHYEAILQLGIPHMTEYCVSDCSTVNSAIQQSNDILLILKVRRIRISF